MALIELYVESDLYECAMEGDDGNVYHCMAVMTRLDSGLMIDDLARIAWSRPLRTEV